MGSNGKTLYYFPLIGKYAHNRRINVDSLTYIKFLLQPIEMNEAVAITYKEMASFLEHKNQDVEKGFVH